MGVDKAQLVLDGVPLLQRAVSTAREAGFAVSVSIAADSALTPRLAAVGVSAVHDRHFEQGPLAGIAAALETLQQESAQSVLFLAVDLPLIPAAFLSCLWNRTLSTDALATIPLVNGRVQPLCAVYASTLGGPIHEALACGERKVMRVLAQIVPANRMDRFQVEAIAPLMGCEQPRRWFNNLNTPEDWAALRQETLRGDPTPRRIYKGTEAR